MPSGGTRDWTLDPGQLRRQEAEIVSPLTGRQERLQWSTRSLPGKGLPISIVMCELKGMGRTVHGYGDQVLASGSLVQAFAEAWERLWMMEHKNRPEATAGEVRSSNGFASGRNHREAEESALGELVERAIFLRAWESRRGWAPLPLSGVFNQVLNASLESLGWTISLYALSEDSLGSVYCGIGRRPGGGILFDCSYKGDRHANGKSQEKVLRSLLRSALILDFNPSPYEPLPEHGDPESHQRYYMNPDHLAAFEFLNHPASAMPLSKLEHYDATITKSLITIEGFPVVAQAANPKWPQLRWGLESLSAGGNPWPHPLA